MSEAGEVTLRKVPASVFPQAGRKDMLSLRGRDSPGALFASNLRGDAIPEAIAGAGAKGKVTAEEGVWLCQAV